MHLCGLLLGRHRERRARTLDGARGLVGQLRRVLPKKRIVMLERHHDAPEGVVVAKPQGIAQAVEPGALRFGRLTSHHLREGLLDAHGTSSAGTCAIDPSMFTKRPRQAPCAPRRATARAPLGCQWAVTWPRR